MYKKPSRSYKLTYSRDPWTRARIRQAVKALRYGPNKLSINRIAKTLEISTRTVFIHIELLREGRSLLQFYAGRARYRRSKKSPGIVSSKGVFISFKELSRRLKAFILGQIDTIEEALGEDPP
jgi:biotin operon repressor